MDQDNFTIPQSSMFNLVILKDIKENVTNGIFKASISNGRARTTLACKMYVQVQLFLIHLQEITWEI